MSNVTGILGGESGFKTHGDFDNQRDIQIKLYAPDFSNYPQN